ncbi:MAG TPA: STAS domain-containing protein [Solirubrobacterales bacterium]
MSQNDDFPTNGLLSVRHADEGSQVRVTLEGELDLSNTALLETALAEAIDSGKKVVIDLGRLEFLDSTGLSLIVRTLGRQDAERFSFLPSRSDGVRRLLNLTGLDERMVISTPAASQASLPTV